MKESSDTNFLAFLGVLGFLLGGSRAMLANDPNARWYHVLARSIISGIVGVCVGAGLLEYWGHDHVYLAMGISSACSWVGVELMKGAGRSILRVRDQANLH